MYDAFFVAVTIVFFAVNAWFIHGCDRLSEEER
jgi:hypothetical protein